MNRFWIVPFFCTAPVVFAEVLDEPCYLSAPLCELQISFESADKELNDVYKRIMNSIQSGELSDSSLVGTGELKQSLVVSQRSWLEFKEKNCDAFYTLHSGGAQRNEARLECEIEMVKERTLYLKSSY